MRVSSAMPVCRLPLLWLFLICCAGISAARADSHMPVYDVFSFSAEADSEIDNDLMLVTAFVEAAGSDATALANDINETMQWATDQLQAFDTITPQTRDYQTYAQYAKNGQRIVGWRARQSLELESDDFGSMTQAIQLLQERLKISQVRLAVKPATRKVAQDILIDSALNAFKQRAMRIQENMNAPGYRILSINISTDRVGGNASYQSRDYGMMARAEVAEPSIAGGTSRIQVRVAGQIELER